MKNWLRKFAERQAPNYITPLGVAWPLLTTKWFGVALVMRYRSDEHLDNRAEGNRLSVVLSGEYLRHYEVPRTGEHEPAVKLPKGTYTYGNQFGLWACRNVKAGGWFLEREGQRGGVELFDARNQEEALVDYANWMCVHDVVYNGGRQVWFLTIVWGKSWA